MTARVFQRGETAQAYAEVRDQDGVLVNPTSIKLDLWNTDYTAQKVTALDMTQLSTGKYIYNYLLVAADLVGFWPAKATITDGTGGGAVVTIEDGGFEVK